MIKWVMKKKVCILLLLVLIFSSFAVSAAVNDTEGRGYACLEKRVTGRCSSLSTEEKALSLLTIGGCGRELISEASSSQCWPKSSCSIKTTAQAALALSKVGVSVTSAKDWLLSQSASFKDMNWFLQVETETNSSCQVTYSDSSYDFTVNTDKTLSGRFGTCLSVFQNYWLKISSSCYTEDIKVSCSEPFITSLLYQKKNTQSGIDFFIPDKTQTASAEGTTTSKVNSLCFGSKGSCNYEGSLWAAVVLSYLGEDVSPYVPYLITASESNSKYVPEAFLYMLTNNFRTELLVKQQQNKWWSASGDKFYDTAIALLPFQNEDLEEKDNARAWLEEVQGADGCWQENVKDTALILYSLWPREVTTMINYSTTNTSTNNQNNNGTVIPINTTNNQTNQNNQTEEPIVEKPDCSSSGFYCITRASCDSLTGTVMDNYGGCFGTNLCCNKEKEVSTTCSDEGGELCSSGQQCLGGEDISSSDSTSLKICCIGGTCGVPQTTVCEVNGGNCRTSCLDTETTSAEECSATTVCCIEKKKSSPVVALLLIGILIILVIIGFVFRKKLREMFLKIKFKKPLVKPGFSGTKLPPTSSSHVFPGALQRRIIPSSSQPKPESRPFLKPSGAKPMPSVPSKPANSSRPVIAAKPSSPMQQKSQPVIQKQSVKKPITKEEKSDLLKKLKDIGK
jgi:hypothetical protein